MIVAAGIQFLRCKLCHSKTRVEVVHNGKQWICTLKPK